MRKQPAFHAIVAAMALSVMALCSVTDAARVQPDRKKALSGHVVWSRKPAGEWVLGYPIGNGRIGGMVLGGPLRERIGLNHDRLWRKYYSYRKYNTASLMPEFRRLCAEDKWDEAQDLMLMKCLTQAAAQGLKLDLESAGINPMVPVGDLGIYPAHNENSEITDYYRSLDLDTGIANASYIVDGVRYDRESFVSWSAQVLVTRLRANRRGKLTGEITLSRLLDPDCVMTGSATPGEVVMKGRLEEGIRFASVLRVINKGGRVSVGRSIYQPPPGKMPAKDPPNTFLLHAWGEPRSTEPAGVSNRFEGADEIIFLLSIATDDESRDDPAGWCRRRLNATPTDYGRLRREHIKDHQRYYRRSELSLGKAQEPIPTDELVEQAHKTGAASALLVEQLFNIGRYLAITSGRPAPAGEPPKCPITLQGIWNQDRRPAWDCDLHFDLNAEMSYWPLSMVNLSDLKEPLADWVISMMPKARIAAMDRYGCRGVFFNIVCGLRDIGGPDGNCMFATGAAAWIAQLLWRHWEYTHDLDFLKNKMYPFLKEIALFYEDNLLETKGGRLVPCPSCSPEMAIAGRKSKVFSGRWWASFNVLATAATWDLELIHEVFSNAITSSKALNVDADKRKVWSEILQRVPMPVLAPDGRLLEWTEEYPEADPGHRHRSHLIGLCSGDRITLEDTPEYLEGARKALAKRHAAGMNSGMAFSMVWDAQLHARLYEPEEAIKQINLYIADHIMQNLFSSLCGWRPGSPSYELFKEKRLWQIESNIAAVGAVSELFFQDRRGLLRLLPALPKELGDGQIRGFRSRGGFEVGMSWKDRRLVEATLKSLWGERCRVKSFNPAGELVVTQNGREVQSSYKDGVTEFDTQRGKTYRLATKGRNRVSRLQGNSEFQRCEP
ncbi:MAG: glycoside hydrolase family 95 protein [Armatimonadetes bacterium]|nr:glycoside hydrolase family 95 protein [Armatimonadota bacterium]